RRRLPRRVQHRPLSSRDAARGPRRDRADVARGGPNRGIRTGSRNGKGERGNVVKAYAIAVLPGDGIGPEVTGEAVRVLQAAAERFGLQFALSHHAVGAAGVAAAGDPLPAETRAAVVQADAVLLGAVGDPSLDH